VNDYTRTPEQREMDRLEAELERTKQERDAAVAELVKVKRDVEWTMGQTKISDILFNSDPVPTAQDGWLPLWKAENVDSDRLAWINKHGRTCLGSGVFVVVLPHGGDVSDETLPEPYNIRHIVDICRRRLP
jgi:hypothetical protein